MDTKPVGAVNQKIVAAAKPVEVDTKPVGAVNKNSVAAAKPVEVDNKHFVAVNKTVSHTSDFTRVGCTEYQQQEHAIKRL